MTISAGLTTICGAETLCSGCPARDLSQGERQLVESGVDAAYYSSTGYAIGEGFYSNTPGRAQRTLETISEDDRFNDPLTLNILGRLANGECRNYILSDRYMEA